METTSTANIAVDAKVPFSQKAKNFFSKLGSGIVELAKTIGMGLWAMFKTPFMAVKNIVMNMVFNFRILFNQKKSSDNVYSFMNKPINYMGFVLLNVSTVVALIALIALMITTFNIVYLLLSLIILTSMSLIEYK